MRPQSPAAFVSQQNTFKTHGQKKHGQHAFVPHFDVMSAQLWLGLAEDSRTTDSGQFGQ